MVSTRPVSLYTFQRQQNKDPIQCPSPQGRLTDTRWTAKFYTCKQDLRTLNLQRNSIPLHIQEAENVTNKKLHHRYRRGKNDFFFLLGQTSSTKVKIKYKPNVLNISKNVSAVTKFQKEIRSCKDTSKLIASYACLLSCNCSSSCNYAPVIFRARP